MIVDVRLIKDIDSTFGDRIMEAVRGYQRIGYRVEIQYNGYTALIIARECDWVGNNS